MAWLSLRLADWTQGTAEVYIHKLSQSNENPVFLFMKVKCTWMNSSIAAFLHFASILSDHFHQNGSKKSELHIEKRAPQSPRHKICSYAFRVMCLNMPDRVRNQWGIKQHAFSVRMTDNCSVERFIQMGQTDEKTCLAITHSRSAHIDLIPSSYHAYITPPWNTSYRIYSLLGGL